MALDKSKLQARMLANSTAKAPAIPKVIPTNLTPTPAKPNGANGTNALQKIPKRTRAKDGNTNTSRYSFEITAELKDQLEQTITDYRKTTGKNISNSAVIRTALAKYLKGGKL